MQCRQAYTENDDELMWKFLVHKSRSRVGDPIQPMGIAIWKEYVDEYRDCGRSYSSLQSHFRRHLLDNIERANLPLKDLLFLIRHLGRPLQRHQKTFIEKKFGCNLLVDQKGLPRMEVVWVTDDRAEDGGAFVPVEEHRTADPPPPQEDDDGWMDAPLRRGSPERNEIIVPLVQRRQSRDAVGTGNRTSEEVMEEEGSPHEDARERSISPSPHEDLASPHREPSVAIVIECPGHPEASTAAGTSSPVSQHLTCSDKATQTEFEVSHVGVMAQEALEEASSQNESPLLMTHEMVAKIHELVIRDLEQDTELSPVERAAKAKTLDELMGNLHADPS